MAGLTSPPPAGGGGGPIAEKNVAETFTESDLTFRDRGEVGLIDGSVVINNPNPICTFEGGSTAPDDSAWSWSSSDSYLYSQQTKVLGGAYTGEFEAQDTNSENIHMDRSSAFQPDQWAFRMFFNDGGDNNNDKKYFQLEDSGGAGVAIVYFYPDGDVGNGSDVYTTVDTSKEHWFMFRLDWSNEEYEVWMDGEYLATEPFQNSATNIQHFHIHNKVAYYGGPRSLYIDSIGTRLAEVTSASPHFEWTQPSDLFAWDTLSFGATPGNGTVEVYVEESTDGGSTWTEVAGPVERGDEIPASADDRVRLRVDITRPSTSDDPRLDYLARRWSY